ncbi:uncharacterized protein FOMMEDRAFT_166326 [Fomitiporia mediterranea MF3/22]|uniref:uncharacterized protein n=1 Tax=Fomitiporia mediterranea (strain MF3/22) TaxID=694068 RepID=UPI0004407E4B|nr:uncharacterized protein FOMMEDRAFT_166326 [Fomitiporia mediterranea MF3/22]EJD06032.1 hypothetical protein FOMMEDRAFT_166326 [Fomitiporia mediterranea MF3/22]
MPRGTKSTQSRGQSAKYKQQTLLAHFSSSPPPVPPSSAVSRGKSSQTWKRKSAREQDPESEVEDLDSPEIRTTKRRTQRRAPAVEEESDSSDVGKIKFESRSISVQSSVAGDSSSEAELLSPVRSSKRQRILNSDSDTGEAGSRSRRIHRRPSRGSEQERDESRSEVDLHHKGKRRLMRGRRPSSHNSDDNNEDDIMDGIDENKIIDDRLRGKQSQKTKFLKNLERLKKKKLGLAASESDEQSSEGDGIIPGARPHIEDDGDQSSLSENNEDSDLEGEIDDFIVDDEADAQTAALPALFSMNTHQDLVHHFKIVCQYLVHLAVTSPAARSRIAERLTSDEYFSVPLSITRRKLSDIRDSIVSSVWRTDYKKALSTYPNFSLHDLDFAIPHCDACNLGGRLSTLMGRLDGDPYDRTTFEPKENRSRSSSDESDGDDEHRPPEFNLGRFCARRTELFHELCHWEFKLFCELLREVEELSSAGRGFVRIAYPRSVAPPDDVSDADQVMEWLDQRGIINTEWLRIKQLMTQATNLEADLKRGKGDD